MPRKCENAQPPTNISDIQDSGKNLRNRWHAHLCRSFPSAAYPNPQSAICNPQWNDVTARGRLLRRDVTA